MTLVGTSSWIDHLHKPDETMERLLRGRQAAVHPFVLGELACGNLRQRKSVLQEIAKQPQAEASSNSAVLNLIESSRLYGRGLSLVDAHLLASALDGGHDVMTGDKGLARAAIDLGIQLAK